MLSEKWKNKSHSTALTERLPYRENLEDSVGDNMEIKKISCPLVQSVNITIMSS
jgi:hypothetical protein